MTRSLLLLCLSSSLLSAGCLPDVWSWEDDLLDPLDSPYSSGGFQIDPTCELTGPLELELGYGELVFNTLPEGHVFKVTFGAQGGSHVYGALRLNNPAPDHPSLEVVFELLSDEDCGPVFDEVDVAALGWAYSEEELEEECPPQRTGFRHGLLRPPLYTTEDGAVEAAGIIIFHTLYGGGGGERVRLSVRDPCGRVGVVERAINQ